MIPAFQLSTPFQTFGCDLRLPKSGHVFLGLGSAEIWTFRSFPRDGFDGRFRQEPTICVRPNGPAYRLRMRRKRQGGSAAWSGFRPFWIVMGFPFVANSDSEFVLVNWANTDGAASPDGFAFAAVGSS